MSLSTRRNSHLIDAANASDSIAGAKSPDPISTDGDGRNESPKDEVNIPEAAEQEDDNGDLLLQSTEAVSMHVPVRIRYERRPLLQSVGHLCLACISHEYYASYD